MGLKVISNIITKKPVIALGLGGVITAATKLVNSDIMTAAHSQATDTLLLAVAYALPVLTFLTLVTVLRWLGVHWVKSCQFLFGIFFVVVAVTECFGYFVWLQAYTHPVIITAYNLLILLTESMKAHGM